MNRTFILFAIAALGILVPGASAGSFVYTSLSAWQGSSPGNSTVLDFESSTVSYYSTFSWSPYAFAPSNGGLYLLPGAASGTGSGNYLTTDLASTMTITLASGVYGVAFNLGSNTSSTATASILGIDANGVQYSTSGFGTAGTTGTAAFWGLRNDVQLVSVKITFTGGVHPQLDNVRYASAALPAQGPGAPEPATWLLVLFGALYLAIYKIIEARRAKTVELHFIARCGGSSSPVG